ncbi:S1-C subfamily serine protease [Labedella gwakjiensis]|uniref:Serine protease n=1 Tax=Labedella gwakjiensis TaxID=390269 RepID=A0A2P8GZE3_9MICO|nr:MarP family serine protease [Labedella gwakjiensis]PSL39328.1 S1-C subfamily serine protease [Labedella gwakjiensis]RUQ86254.1 serine protease [Labedella gwakjiensis]
MNTVVDIVLLLIMVGAVIGGWRRGALVTAASLVGILGGVVLATNITPIVVAFAARFGWVTSLERTLVAVVVLIVSIALVVAVLSLVARALKGALSKLKITKGLDTLGGAALGFLTWAATVWLLAGFLASTGVVPLTQLASSSRVVAALDSVAPVPSSTALGALDRALGNSGFPQVFADGVESIVGVTEPDPAVSGAVDASAGAIVRVLSSAPSCASDATGSGWVVGTDRVVTNAHVVGGSDDLFVQIGGTGNPVPATLVVFDPERDLAVLAVPGLGVSPLALGDDLAASEQAYVAGYPENGPYDVQPARVRQTLDATGLDIYERDTVTREIYALRGLVRPGNSGGPLLDTDGDVVGVVFARSTTDADTGYALTLDELAPVLDRVASSAEVDSGACVA